ncbi:MAG TPA: type I DNA topoisomerase [Bdellovibrionota bacterium]|jgi:DNA topoisomerase-1|nr:type I DNA topoisomerase [Bdellovibrionota bacterium]
MSKSSLVIVESPTKAKTIRKFLPKEFKVEASMGHIRDLPQTAADIPASLKKEEWAKLGVDVDNNFEPLYIVPKDKKKIVADLKKKIADADILYLATDEDREGESISWHLLQLLKPKIPVKRMVFHEITKSAITEALNKTRQVDEKLVRAQEARRILDRLVGYTVSPLLWKKIAYGLSAGRVQSSGLRLLVDRERERMVFKSAEYWDVDAELAQKGETFKARLIEWSGKRLATGKDFEDLTGKLRDTKLQWFKESDAKNAVKTLKSGKWKVLSVEEKPFTSKPSVPFITSTLQQEANRKLGLSSREAMRTAQRLYEEGFITYMRTDSPSLSKQATKAARDCVEDLFGKEYLSAEVRYFASKSKGAQEAHEAIRPAGSEFVHPKNSGLSGKELALYNLIWMRTVASQMAEAKKLSVIARIESGEGLFQASGTTIIFAGFLRAYVESSDDPEAALEDKEVVLPAMKKGDELNLVELDPLSHATLPPARFTEASLIKILEKEGVGRPSTYASIIDTIVNRGYVRKNGNALVPTFTGMAVVQFLEKHFSELVDLGFTSQMEESLDEIAEGNLEWIPYLKKFYLGATGLRSQVEKKEKSIDPTESRSIDIKNLEGVEVRIGRFGPYVVKEGSSKNEESVNASIPESYAPADLTPADVEQIIKISAEGPKPIGVDPETKLNIYCLLGRFGPYVQLGEVTDDMPKPKRSSVPKGMNPAEITLDQALHLLALPRDLGVHPTSKKPIVANRGRFGPYVMHDGDFRSLKKDDDVYTVTLARALEILAEEKQGRRGAKVLKEFDLPGKKVQKVQLLEGKYGPYLKLGKKNFSVPKEIDAATLELPKVIEIVGIEEKATKAVPKTAGGKPMKPSPGTKNVVRKGGAKKSIAKKAAAGRKG